MPLAIDTNQTFKVVLTSDRDKPEGEQPAFIYRYSSGRQWREARMFHEKIMSAKEDADMPFDTIDGLYDQLRINLVGWENMGGREYNPATIDDILTLPESFELLALKLSQLPDDADKKKFALPSRSNMGRSAKTAKGRKTAKTSQQ